MISGKNTKGIFTFTKTEGAPLTQRPPHGTGIAREGDGPCPSLTATPPSTLRVDP
jgi:hypothetical protein